MAAGLKAAFTKAIVPIGRHIPDGYAFWALKSRNGRPSCQKAILDDGFAIMVADRVMEVDIGRAAASFHIRQLHARPIVSNLLPLKQHTSVLGCFQHHGSADNACKRPVQFHHIWMCFKPPSWVQQVLQSSPLPSSTRVVT